MKLKLIIFYLIILNTMSYLPTLPMSYYTIKYYMPNEEISVSTEKIRKGSHDGNLNLVKEAISEGVNDEEINKAFIRASFSNYSDIMEFLLGIGVDINLYDQDFGNPLIRAAEKSNLKMIEYLLNKRANINIKEPIYNETPLMEATKQGHEEVVIFLLMQGSDVNIKNKAGETALDIAKYEEYQRLIALTPTKNYPKIVKILQEWPKTVGKSIKQTEVIPIEGICDIIAEYATGYSKEEPKENTEARNPFKKAKL